MWQMKRIVIVLSLSVWLVYGVDGDTESSTSTLGDLTTCDAKDENISDCLLKVFTEMIPRAKNGIPELNIPPMDPFVINRTSYIFSHPIVQGRLMVRNMKIHGISKTTTKSLDYHRDGNVVTTKINSHIPKLFVEGMYKAKIKLNTANISSKGPFNVTFTNIDFDVQSIADVYERDGHRYMRLKSYNIDPTIGSMKFYAEGLLPEPMLNDAILEFINQNFQSIYKTLVPETRAAWEPEIVKLGNQYFSHIPIDAFIKED